MKIRLITLQHSKQSKLTNCKEKKKSISETRQCVARRKEYQTAITYPVELRSYVGQPTKENQIFTYRNNLLILVMNKCI